MESVEVVIVGSGYGGSIPALRLAEAGARVVVLERGPRREAKDLVQADDPVTIASAIDLVVSSSNIAFRTGTMLGGASINMDGAFFRMPQQSFGTRDGDRPYWPEGIDRATLDPFYATVEERLSVRRRTWDEIPKAGGMFGKMCSAAGASCNRSPMNYVGCVQCGFCTTGCIFDKKMTLLHTYIPAAEAAGAEFRTGCRATTLEPPTVATPQWVVRYQADGAEQAIAADRVFVAGGGLHTPALLLRSRANLPALSAQLGEHFNNNGEHTFIGILPEGFDGIDDYVCWKGMDNAGLMTFAFWDEHGFTLHPGAGFEPTLLASDLFGDADPVLPPKPWGMAWKRFVETVYPSRIIGFSALGIAPSHAAVTLARDGFSPDVVARDSTAHDAYLDRLETAVIDMGRKAGVTLLPTTPRRLAGTTSAHLLSACRMAESADHGVVDPDGRVFGYEGLYICDASAVPHALGVNPALTISALAERCAQAVAREG